ncbi:uncharacterized protein LOC143431783 [Xylocopa sonorina]|uniref:uncharacterized protein LOC143431783 n=1 Tax=Xylocopa sonorina TaxID=1818115 RepID=UPI00403AD669
MVELVVVAEPFRVLQRQSWARDLDDSVVIAQSVLSRIRPIAPVACGHCFMAIDWADYLVVGVYAPTSWPLSRINTLMDGLQNVVSLDAARPVFVFGYFNTHETAWHSPRSDQKGHSVLDCEAGLGSTTWRHSQITRTYA